ncbi:TetR/AcrR family transcriptional regulator [Ferrovibrio sp.]|uniref:TetR/AcrR family transcriptional regulator n=1 Tax=Ferrovibrio sp. TaxID=1917215 RepID=UPI0025C2023C|nr:TetR/AcrR family transcriptional regulator [Ferrovibrio sp.]MBX3454790.1 TetR/AcrR family transcriptional regulator [Ferrovibrio sp.]
MSNKSATKPGRGRPADPAKRDAILTVARKLFYELGYGIGLDAIAREAGVARQTIYNLFASKDELFAAIVSQGAETIAAPLRDLPADAEPRDVLIRFGENYLAVIQSDRSIGMQRMLISSAQAFPEMVATFFANGPAINRQRLADFLRKSAPAANLRIEDPAEAADHLIGMMIGTIAMRRTLGLMPPLSEAAMHKRIERAVDTFLRAYRV